MANRWKSCSSPNGQPDTRNLSRLIKATALYAMTVMAFLLALNRVPAYRRLAYKPPAAISRCVDFIDTPWATGEDMLFAKVVTGAVWTSLACAAAFATRACYPKDAYDILVCEIGLVYMMLAVVFMLSVSNGYIIATVFSQNLVHTTLVFAQIVNLVACSGPYGRLYLLKPHAYLSLVAFIVAGCGPGAWSTAPIVRRDPSSPTRHCLMTSTAAAPTVADTAALGQVYANRLVWPEGAGWTAVYLLFTAGRFAWLASAIWAMYVAVEGLKQRMPTKSLRVIATIVQLIDLAYSVVLALLGFSHLGRKLLMPHQLRALICFLAYALRFAIKPMAALSLLEATHEHEQQALALLADAERAQRHAEEVAATRRAFLRYVFHELRVPMNTMALGIEDLEASLNSLAEVIPAGSGQTEACANAAIDKDTQIATHSTAGMSVPNGGESFVHRPTSRELSDTAVEGVTLSTRPQDQTNSSPGSTDTPVTPAYVLGGRRLIEASGLVAQGRETLHLMSGAATAARHTIDSTLAIERIDAGEQVIELQPTSLQVLLRETCASMRLHARQAGIDFSFSENIDDGAASPSNVLGCLDDVKMSQVSISIEQSGHGYYAFLR